MASPDSRILHVSDTAVMVCGCRALETARPDGFVRDPFAERLAGERGMAIARAQPDVERMCFGIGIRSYFIDELIGEIVAERAVATVLSLGAGLDTRPWRLELPPSLRWIEVDFPEMLDYKAGLLAGEPPRCRYERFSADLNNQTGRDSVFAAAGTDPTLLITEGLLSYLPSATVETLTAAPVRYWLADITSEAFVRRAGQDLFRSIAHVRAEDSLNGSRILELLAARGWKSWRSRRYRWHRPAIHVERTMAAVARARASGAPPLADDDPTGVHIFARGE